MVETSDTSNLLETVEKESDEIQGIEVVRCIAIGSLATCKQS